MLDDGRLRTSGDKPSASDAQWARLRIDIDSALRRGAWYRVLSVSRVQATVSVNRKPVAMPRERLEFRSGPPQRWTVVRQPKPVTRMPASMRDGYVVCPSCRNRVHLPPRGTHAIRCPRCNVLSDVSWDENYLSESPRRNGS